MAKISAITKNRKRIKKVMSSFKNRAALREINKNGTFEEQQVSQKKPSVLVCFAIYYLVLVEAQ